MYELFSGRLIISIIGVKGKYKPKHPKGQNLRNTFE